MQILLNLFRVSRLARAWQTTNDDKSRSLFRFEDGRGVFRHWRGSRQGSEIMNDWYGNKASLFISAPRWCVGRVASGVYRDIPHSLGSYDLKYMAVHQRPDAFTLAGWMNGIDANRAPLLRAIDLVMDETYCRSILLCHKEAVSCV
jgi:hypothetical protein